MKNRNTKSTISVLAIGLFLSLVFESCSPSLETENSLTKFNLKGKVVSIEEVLSFAEDASILIESDEMKKEFGEDYNSNLYAKTLRVFNKKGYLVEFNQYFNNGDLAKKYLYKYDKKGNLINEQGIDIEGALEKEIIYDSKGNEIEIKYFDSNGEITRKITHDYDTAGNNIETIWYDSNGWESKRKSKFNSKGIEIECTNLNRDDDDFSYKSRTYNYDKSKDETTVFKHDIGGEVLITEIYNSRGNKIQTQRSSSKTEYYYDDMNKIIEKHNYWDDKFNGKSTYEYDSRGHITEECMYQSNGGLKDKDEYKYNAQGKLIEHRQYRPSWGTYLDYYYVYDENGNLIQENSKHSKENTMHQHLAYEYDQNNNLIQKIEYNDYDGEIYKSHQFRYDKENNWISKRYYKAKKLQYTITRKIEY
nr:hypothetical protein [uncultured Draconibacterium sp.]